MEHEMEARVTPGLSRNYLPLILKGHTPNIKHSHYGYEILEASNDESVGSLDIT